MSWADPLPFNASLEEYRRQAETLLAAVRAGDQAAGWCFKWMHPRFRDESVAAVRAATLDLADAQTVVAREHGFGGWGDLSAFTDRVGRDGPVDRFEAAVPLVGLDADTLPIHRGQRGL